MLLLILGKIFANSDILRDYFIMIYNKISITSYIFFGGVFPLIACACLCYCWLYFTDKVAVTYSKELWTISFSSETIEISSNKRAISKFYLSQLAEVQLLTPNGFRRKSSKCGIVFSFNDLNNKTTVMKLSILSEPILFPGVVKWRENTALFNQLFIASFEKQILQTQYQLKTSRYFTPSKHTYIRS